MADLMASMKPTPVMMIGGYMGASQQDNANAAWKRLGEKMGFDWDTVQPNSKGYRFFSAVPSETDIHRAERLTRETNEKRALELAQIKETIAALTKRQSELEGNVPS